MHAYGLSWLNFLRSHGSWLLGLFLAVAVTGCRSTLPPLPAAGDAPSAARQEDVALTEMMFAKGKAPGGGFFLSEEELALVGNAPASFVVELDQQRAYLYRGAKLVAVSRLSSGRPHHRTETGVYAIGEKKAEHRSSLYGDYVDAQTGAVMMNDITKGFDPMPPGAKYKGSLMAWFMRFHRHGKPTAIGVHIGELPGRPASHGCVRLPAKMAKWFYQHVAAGTPVYVRGTKYGVPYGTSQPRPKREPRIHPSLKAQTEPAGPMAVPAGAEGASAAAPATGEAAPATAPVTPTPDAPAPAVAPEPPAAPR
jgi:L,D-transpeptidase catalytic domain